MIAANKMMAVWDRDPATSRISGLMVVDQQNQPAEAHRYRCSSGACEEDWMKGNPIRTPLGLFAELAAGEGFVSHEVVLATVRQFAQVEGQTWATELLERLGS